MTRRERRFRAALLLATVVAILSPACGGSEPDSSTKLNDVADTVAEPLTRLSSAVESARPSDRHSLVTLRATAGRTGTVLSSARGDLRDLEAAVDPEERAKLREFESALDEYQVLADELARTRLSATSIEVAAERARQARRDSRVALPNVDATTLVAALRRRHDTKAPVDGGLSAPVGEAETPSAPSSSISYRTYTGPAFQARIPTGGGWAEPSQSEPTPGQLFRTNVRGPNGLFVIIDFTPFEAASFGSSSYDSKTEVGQTAFGSATRYVFRGGRISECQRATCIDYIINSGGTSGGSGFAVLAGGGDAGTAGQIAQTVAESVTPIGQYGE